GTAQEAQGFANLRAAVAAGLAAMTWIEVAALAVLAFGAVAWIVTARAALEALLARYRRQLLVAGAGLVLYGVAFVVRQLMPDDADDGIAIALDALFGATLWIAAAGAVLGTGYLFRQSLRDAVLSPRQAGVAVLLAAIATAAWLSALRAGGAPLPPMTATGVRGILAPALLPHAACARGPW